MPPCSWQDILFQGRHGGPRPSPISRQPSRSRLLSTDTMSSFGIGASWYSCYSARASSTTRTRTSSASRCTRSTIRTFWTKQWSYMLGFGIGSAGWRKQSLRLYALRIFMRRLGPRNVWRLAGLSFGISRRKRKSRLPLVSRILGVSSCQKRCLCYNSSFSARGTENNLTSLFKWILPRTTDPASGRIPHS